MVHTTSEQAGTTTATQFENVSFVTYHPDFSKLLGSKPTAHLLVESSDKKTPLYHEACIYHHATRSVFVTSNQVPADGHWPHTGSKQIKLSRIYDNDNDDDDGSGLRSASASSSGHAKAEFVHFKGVESAMLNGGVNFGENALLLCAQGSHRDHDLQGLIAVDIPGTGATSASTSPAEAHTVVSSFYGVPFNSVNDVIVHPKDQSIWFTDPEYGFHQGIRPQPQLPNQVYRFDPATKAIRAVADGFTRPNGLCFSPELDKLYVTDTGCIHGSSSKPLDPTGPSHIYCYDIVYPEKGSNEPILVNRRLFAFAAGRCPDGIKCDTKGNVYSGCLNGIEVWNSSGVLLGLIRVKGGVANFCFGEKGTIYACNEVAFWKVKLNGDGVKGALLGI